MSYAIIRNAKYKRENLKGGIYRHNERRNKNYSNKNIDKEKSYGFDLERGNPSERVHLSVEDYKKITNYVTNF